MASPSSANGSLQAASVMTPAQRLMEKHSAERHPVTVEDAVDEDDVAHPRPSMGKTVFDAEADAPMRISDDATEAKKDQSDTSAVDAHTANAVPFNTRSEELFPALGSPKPRVSTAAAASTAWGKKPVPADGVNGPVNKTSFSSDPSSRASTPASATCSTTSPKATRAAPSREAPPSLMALPGRHTERIQFVPSQLTPRSQLKKPVLDVLRDINKRSKAKVEMRPGQGGAVVFEGQGPVDAVRQALKEVASQLGSKQSVKVAIPASVRPHVIGRQGATVQAITKRTGARIQVPKHEESSVTMEEDDGATIDVLIEGDALSAEMARREIEGIVSEKASTVNMRLRDIPAEYYPFLAGAHNSRIKTLQQGRNVLVHIPAYHVWTHQPPMQPLSKQTPIGSAPQPNLPIQISGDRAAAQEARAELERELQRLKQNLVSDEISIERGRHQFVVGDKGCSLHDFLEETGCTVVIPASTMDCETLTIMGPADRLESGINKVMDLASSMAMASVDLGRQHPDALTGAHGHARNLTRYFQQRLALDQLERQHEATIVVPKSRDSPMTWEIYSRDGKNTMRARADIMNIVSGHPPSRLMSVKVDPILHAYLRERHAQQIRDAYGVHIVFPDVDDASDLLLVYEGLQNFSQYQLPRRQPSAAEVREFERALKLAENEISSLVEGQEEISSRDFYAPEKLCDRICSFVEREQRDSPDDTIPVQLQKGHQSKQPAGDHHFTLRGPSSAVDGLYSKLLPFIKQERQNEVERGYRTSFDYPQKYANILIGKKGENVRKLREEFDVDIQVGDGKVELTGPVAKADAAKSYIIALGRKLDDEVTHIIKVNPIYHGDLIGARGSQVRRLQERYDVRVMFPRAMNDDSSNTKSASDGASASRHSRSQAPDEVIIKGPRRGADEARDELLNLLQWTIDNSHTAIVSVASSQLPSLIGQGGREMESLRLSTGAQIDVPDHRSSVAPSGRAEIRLRGTKKQVEEAKELLDGRVRTFENTVVKTVDVPKRHHKTIIGGNGSRIRNIIVEAGGPDDRQSRMVRFPSPDSSDSTVKVEGEKAVVDRIVASIESIARELDSHVTESIEVAPAKHSKLIGRGGETRRDIESRCRVNIEIPKKDTPGPAGSKISITGSPDDVLKAKRHISGLVAEHEAETIPVPLRLHYTVADNGQFIRRLRNDFRVNVDHGGRQLPARTATSRPRDRVFGGSLPLITDDANKLQNADNHLWELVEHTEPPVGPGNYDGDDAIPWILRGAPENVARAKKSLETALEDARKQVATGYLVLPDPRAYRVVVGPGGMQINSIRNKTGTKIQVPRDQAKGEAIEIAGSKEGVQEAKDIILRLVRDSKLGGEGHAHRKEDRS